MGQASDLVFKNHMSVYSPLIPSSILSHHYPHRHAFLKSPYIFAPTSYAHACPLDFSLQKKSSPSQLVIRLCFSHHLCHCRGSQTVCAAPGCDSLDKTKIDVQAGWALSSGTLFTGLLPPKHLFHKGVSSIVVFALRVKSV